IFTVSEFSKRELSRYCHIPPERITVVYPGVEHILRVAPDERILDRHALRGQPFLFAVSSNSPHKNFAALLAAIRRLGNVDFKFVIAGGTFGRVFQSTGVEELPENVIRVGYVSDGELRALYEHARAFVFPSYYEGFGIPPLEAMACGCPVICSNAASLPEVCGDAAVYFEPRDVEGIGNQICQVMKNPVGLASLIARGFARAHAFKWEQTARRLIETLVCGI
ncbi:MAG TPA: glycosyltransferase family 1 protein, partial [Anaerovoracaceae bacterium]|nr:glycosyltransferase family 1 protein [Anaerovoracaceae bacterium]